ncbi:MAG: DNA-binding transcriptional regulator [Planctomycetes bacterium]|nr:DNA-binding transcriptional regulator [Planctomycetota bacterium]
MAYPAGMARYPTPPLRVALLFDMAWGYYRGLLRGIMDYAKPGKNWVFRMNRLERLDAGRLPRLIERWKPHGVIVPMPDLETARRLQRWGRPVVNVTHHARAPRIPRVGVREDAVGAEAARYFLARGFRNLAFAGNGAPYSDERRDAYTAALMKAGIKPHVFENTRETVFTRWLRELPKPAAVFCCTDGLCWEAAELCASAGLRVPEELALLGVDNDEFQCALAHPPLSSVANPAREVGYEAARMLDRMLRGGRPPVRPVLFMPQGVVTRHSTDVLAMEDRDLAAAVRYINEHCERPLAVKEILRAVPVSRRALELKFRGVLGRSPLQEIRRVRIERARRLIAESDLPLKEIARRTGFGGPIQFASVFRKATGAPPSALRKRSRGH